MSKRIETSIIINKPLDAVWQEVKVMENHVNWMEDAVKIDILSENNSGIDTKMNVLTKVGPIKLTDIITVTEWKENCLLYTSPSPRDRTRSRMPSSA